MSWHNIGMEPFKTFLSPAVVQEIGAQMARAGGFDAERFTAEALAGLEALELKARAVHIAGALVRHGSPDPAMRRATLAEALHPETEGSGPLDGRGLRGWAVWPLTMVVAREDLAEPEAALDLLRQMTMRFTSEFAVRPFLNADLAGTLAILDRWRDDPNPHVRRWLSEGTRPRLPWGESLPALIADPTPTLSLLAHLRDDPSEYVRRSVANHLNDIARDHPAKAVLVAGDWMAQAPAPRQALLRHAMRGRIKAGDPAALALFGQAAPKVIAAAPVIETPTIREGDGLVFSCAITSTSDTAQSLTVDYVVHLRKADGTLKPKVFKGATWDLGPGETRLFRRTHPFRAVTTRLHYSGPQALALRINGQDTPLAPFTLL